jgi:hypothetical protein
MTVAAPDCVAQAENREEAESGSDAFGAAMA